MALRDADGPELEYARGDLAPLRLTFKKNGTPIDLTGYTALVITINSDLNPTDVTDQVGVLTGTLTGTPTDGIVDFAPASQPASDALVPGVYFYDISGIDGGGRPFTLAKGSFTIVQDIGK